MNICNSLLRKEDKSFVVDGKVMFEALQCFSNRIIQNQIRFHVKLCLEGLLFFPQNVNQFSQL